MKKVDVESFARSVGQQQLEATKVLGTASAAILLMAEFAEAHRQQDNAIMSAALQTFSKAMADLYPDDPNRAPDYVERVARRLGVDFRAVRKDLVQ